METPLEDGFYLAVPNHVDVILRSVLFDWLDAPRVHAADTEKPLERRFQCEFGPHFRSVFRGIPLARDALLTSMEIAVIYLATFAVAGGIFMFCSFWIYHYVDLEHDSGDMTELEPVASFLS